MLAVGMDTFRRTWQDRGQGALSIKQCVKTCFSLLASNLKIAKQEHSCGHSSSSGICVFPDPCPTRSHMTCVCVCVVPTVTPQLQSPESHLESVSAGLILRRVLMREQVAYHSSSSVFLAPGP